MLHYKNAAANSIKDGEALALVAIARQRKSKNKFNGFSVIFRTKLLDSPLVVPYLIYRIVAFVVVVKSKLTYQDDFGVSGYSRVADIQALVLATIRQDGRVDFEVVSGAAGRVVDLVPTDVGVAGQQEIILADLISGGALRKLEPLDALVRTRRFAVQNYPGSVFQGIVQRSSDD